MNFFKSLFASKKPVPVTKLSHLEIALLTSLRTEPDAWSHAFGKNPEQQDFLSMTHRAKGVTVNSKVVVGGGAPTSRLFFAWYRELNFSTEFSIEWHTIAQDIAAERATKTDTVRAEAVHADMSKRMGV